MLTEAKLQELELKAASYGLSADPVINIEIKDINEKIAQLDALLNYPIKPKKDAHCPTCKGRGTISIEGLHPEAISPRTRFIALVPPIPPRPAFPCPPTNVPLPNLIFDAPRFP